MAPGFFSKLVKPGPSITVNGPQGRDRSFEQGAGSASTTSLNISSTPSRSRTVSVIDTPNGRASEFGQLGVGRNSRSPNSRSNTRVVSNSSKGENGGDRGYQSDSSANPSVHVVPPSPMVSDGSPIGGGITGLPDTRQNGTRDRSPGGVEGLPGSGSGSAANPPTQSSAPAVSNGTSGKKSNRSRPTTPASSTSPITTNAPLPQSPNSAAQTLQAPTDIKHKTSNRSLRSIFTGANTSPPAKNATAAHNPKVNSLDSTNSNTSSGGSHALVESPTAMETEFVFTTDGQGKEDVVTPKAGDVPASPHKRSKSTGTPSSPDAQQAPHRKEATVGVFGQSGRPGSGWRKPTSKPTGLAGAIAASGLAMANPGLTGVQGPQLSPPLQRQMNRQNSTSGISHTTSTTYVDEHAPPPPPNPPKRKKEKKRTSTISDPHTLPAPNLGDHDYYSGLESGSEDSDGEFDDDSEDEEILGRRRGRGRGGGGRSEGDVSAGGGGGGGGESRSRLGSGDSLPFAGAAGPVGAGGPGDAWGRGGGGGGGGQDWGVTGFAVASSRRNGEFHELFLGFLRISVPYRCRTFLDYGCALQREILIQGRLYISENHICFHANILGWITDLSIPIYEITALEKKMTAFVIPNAIQITTRRAKYSFASFLARDTTYDVIYNIWRLARPADTVEVSVAGKEIGEEGVGALGGNSETSVAQPGGGGGGTSAAAGPKKTTCGCLKEGKHFTETALDTVIPGTPDRIHNLLFASGFIKEFMSGEQKLTDIQMSDWTPTSPTAPQGLLARNMSYIKPLNAPVGPKSTKCEIRDEIVHCDFEDYVSTISTTRTPDVPSGSVFSVKTRTCVMWASVASSRVVVTTQVEWTGRSFIKGIIERSAIDGQKTQYTELDRAMRAYIKEHQSEFLPDGVDLAQATPAASQEVDAAAAATTTTEGGGDVPPTPKERERERNQRAFQWAWDTFDGAFNVAKTSAKGAIELIWDAWDQSETTTMLYFVIVGLVLSNVWTWFSVSSLNSGSVGKRELRELRELRRELRERDVGLLEVTTGRKGAGGGGGGAGGKEEDGEGEREKWIQGIVSALRDEMKHPTSTSTPTPPAAVEITDEEGKIVKERLEETVARLTKALDDIEEKARLVRQTLQQASLGSLD
ncbi:hypothetical protein AAF712_003494 [Marasmius tenuissimus]|uniref:VASt domain-containing protein n=1 Tax=Marasmius tenuissimus TaxID=585030 RepID=A0ABR3A6D7_9AGAR